MDYKDAMHCLVVSHQCPHNHSIGTITQLPCSVTVENAAPKFDTLEHSFLRGTGSMVEGCG